MPAFLVLHHLRSLLQLMSIESGMPSNHLILCHPLLLLPSIFLSIRVFSNKSALCIRWLQYWSFSFSISPSDEYSGLISFRIDWFDLLAIQGTLNKSSPALQIPIRGVEFPTQCTKTRLNGYRCAVLFICFFSNGELSQ